MPLKPPRPGPAAPIDADLALDDPFAEKAGAPGALGAPSALEAARPPKPPLPVARAQATVAVEAKAADPVDEVVIDEEIVVEDEALSLPPPPVVSAGDDACVVLVVEDDPSIRMMIVRALGMTYTVYEADDGAAGLALIQKIPNPDAIVCDVMMPKMDGLEFAKAIKKEQRLKFIPIIFLTAKDSALDVVSGINAGARHYLTKPFKVKDLVEKVASVIKKK